MSAAILLGGLLAVPSQAVAASTGEADAATDLAVGLTASGEELEAPGGALAATEETIEPYTGSGDMTGAGPNVSFEPTPEDTSGGDVSIDSVIGTDNRTRITATTSHPSRAIVYLTSSDARCTGFLVSKDTVVTAGHCVHPGGTGSTADFFSDFRAYPGKNGSSNPYGSCGWTQVWTDNAWINDEDGSHDWGVIKLNCSIGNTVGWLGYRWQGASLNGTSVTVRGYPDDKAYATLWTHSGSIQYSYTNILGYTIDTGAGQSGSPAYDANLYAVGIHVRGAGGSIAYNQAKRITESLFDIIQGIT
ncbi:glutamyl endopeptidase [Streptomyces sp. cf386]|uniref:trypsin-like serine peptidase n=1 Tax=Streptomyces sp. cf386 TaxID=1761904 RepID=UPI0008833977|nr:serine protease [Streptomyces sp. cf386]SDM94348.1 glutamyl endopeptidase [Streptomyces sp. cf386]